MDKGLHISSSTNSCVLVLIIIFDKTQFMKTIFLLTGTAFILMISCQEQQNCAETVGTPDGDSAALPEPNAYDSLLAHELGADEYGMKTYVMAFLKKGPNRDLDSAASADLQAQHMENINRMAEEGTLVLAGPFYGDGELRGIYLFDVATIEEAEALTNTDPAVQAGSLVMELQMWYGSAALMQVNAIHNTIAKQQH
jgi:uncharacterized protein